MKFIASEIYPGDILAGRNLDPKAVLSKAIRATLGSYTNHNALFLHHPCGEVMIGDTIEPKSIIRPLDYYENAMSAHMYEVRIWRVRDMSMEERMKVSDYWIRYCNGVEYPSFNLMRLWVFRIVNSLPWEIQGAWCTKNTLEPFQILPPERDPRMKPDGTFKKNPTPRTMENRLVAGVLEDVTGRVVST